MSTLIGMGAALRLTLRRNWLFWTLWIVCLTTLIPATHTQYETIVPPGTDPRIVIEPLVANPIMPAIVGPAFDVYSSSAAFTFWWTGGITAMLAGLAGGFGIIRATRVEEEAGRIELFRSGPIGRHTPLASALTVNLGACALLGSACTAAMTGMGMPAVGSSAAGLAITLTGAMYVGIGAVCAQVFDSARTARVWAVGVGLGGAYLLRAMVDASGDRLTELRWLIPLEWGMLARPFGDERWWVFLLPVALAFGCIALAVTLESRRDHGAGLRQAKLGRRTAAGYLRNTWGLAWRLQRTGLIAWSLAMLGSAVAFGSMVIDLDSMFDANPEMTEMLQRMGGTEQLEIAFFISTLVTLVPLLAIMGVTLLNHLNTAEERGWSELALAGAASRFSYAGSHLVWALAAPALLSVGAGAGLVSVQASVRDDWAPLGDYAAAGAALIPGVVLVVGLAMALIGWAPRLFPVVWAVLGWSLYCTWIAVLFDLPEWLLKAHPWGHLSVPPRDQMDWTAFVVELAVGFALVGVGLVGYRRRDLPAG